MSAVGPERALPVVLPVPEPVDLLPDGPALLHDAAGTVVAATPELARLVGVAHPRELVGRAVGAFVVTDPRRSHGGAGATAERARLLRPTAPAVSVRLVRWTSLPGTSLGALLFVDVSDLADGPAPADRAPTTHPGLVALAELPGQTGPPALEVVTPRGPAAPTGTTPLGPGPHGPREDDRALRTSARHYDDLMALAPVGIAVFDDDERLVEANQSLCRLLGVGRRALVGCTADELLDLAAEDDAAPGAVPTPLLARPAGSAGSVSWSCPARALRRRERGGRGAPAAAAWCELHVSVSTHADGSVTHLVVLTDVTDALRTASTLRHLATHDELTGLPNRRALAATVSHLLHGPSAPSVGVLFCDLVNFTRVNDSLGHEAGDELLVELAGRLRDRLPAGCGAVRVSGDEFAVVCADVDRLGGLDVLSSTVARILRTAVPVHGQLVRISAAVGAVVARTAGVGAAPPPSEGDTPEPDSGERDSGEPDTGDPVTAVLRRPWAADGPGAPHPRTGDLLRFADAALFQAKRNTARGGGPGRFALADEATVASTGEALRLEEQLREALARDELVLHFQPVVGPDGRVQTAEALVRWQHPERGLLYPDTFLPVAAAADLMGEIDRWVLRAAVREAARWPAADGPAASVAVNLAGFLPGDAEFLPYVRECVAAAGLPWDRLVLELVETCLADLPKQTLGEMTELIDAGVRFAVDDFGTGYSSLSRLTGLPAQIVKLDRAFVRGVATGESDRAVAQAVVQLAAAIGQTCVAEGVEDAEQFAVLRDLGVDAYQGWLFARAMPAPALTELLADGPIAPRGPGAVG